MQNGTDQIFQEAPERLPIMDRPIVTEAAAAYTPESQSMFRAAISPSSDSAVSSLPHLDLDFSSDGLQLPPQNPPFFTGGAGGSGGGWEGGNTSNGSSDRGAINIDIGDGLSSSPSSGQGPVTYNFDFGGDNATPVATAGTTYNFNLDVAPSTTGGQSPDITINIGDSSPSTPTPIGDPVSPVLPIDQPAPLQPVISNSGSDSSATAGTGGDITPATANSTDATSNTGTTDSTTASSSQWIDQALQSLQTQLSQIEASLGLGQTATTPTEQTTTADPGTVNGAGIPIAAVLDPTNPSSPLNPTNPDSILDPQNPDNPVNVLTNPSNPLNPVNVLTNPSNPLNPVDVLTNPKNPLNPANVLNPTSSSSPLNPSNIGNDLNPFSSSNPITSFLSSLF